MFAVLTLISGCLDGDPTPEAGSGSASDEGEGSDAGVEEPVLVRRVENRSESGSAAFAMVAGFPGGGRAFIWAQGFDVKRPEHLVEARFLLTWSSQAQAVAGEVAFLVEQDAVINQTYGSGELELTVTGDEWTSRNAQVRIDPYWHEDLKAGAQVDWQWQVEVTLVEEFMLNEDADDAGTAS